MGAKEIAITEVSALTMEDVFGDLHPKGHQTNIDSTEAVEGEGAEPKIIEPREVTLERS